MLFSRRLASRDRCIRLRGFHLSVRLVAAIAGAAALTPASAAAQSSENVAVVINDDNADSVRVGEHYIRARSIPETNVIRLKAPSTAAVSRQIYESAIEAPIRTVLGERRLHDRILYIVLTKGVPLRIEGTDGLNGTGASVDSELTLLYRRMSGQSVQSSGRALNPYFFTGSSREPMPFSHRDHDIFLVTRLDGFTVEDVLALIDRAKAPTSEGQFVLDQRGGLTNNPAGDIWLQEAGRRLALLGFDQRVVLEKTREAARNLTNVLGYYSWASNDPAHRQRQTSLQFVPGSIVASFGGPDARTMQEPRSGWVPSANWQDRSTWHEGAPSSLVADIIREGATGVAGHVADPFLQSAVRPEILFPAYVKGLNLAEAFYLSIPHLSWQTVVIGDPLCRPFPRTPLTASELEDGLDERTELPRLFSQRRMSGLQALFKDIPEEAIALVVQAEGRQARADAAGAQQSFEKATEVAPNLAVAHLQLAILYEQAGDFQRALPRYERVVELQPNNVIALNNLAYNVAVQDKAPARAKPLAERALKLVPRDPAISDTLGWIEYLLGNYAAAARLAATAVKGAPGNADIRLHAAFIYAANQSQASALTELEMALKLNPALGAREDVKELEKKIKPSAPGATAR
jgi:uncharacterized protein (TIGR03790 family)